MTALLFDLFGVLLKERTDAGRRRVERAIGADENMWPIYDELRPAYNVGDVSDERFWRQLQIRAGLETIDIAEAIAADWESTSAADPEMVALVKELFDARVRLGILTNIPAGLAKQVRAEHTWIDSFDAVTLSCDIGVAKPDPRAFAVAAAALNVAPKEVLYFDADPINVAAANESGLKALLFTGTESVRKVLP
ncbi:Alpha-D-glucose-1-phosphate phosphatase YihX [Corynebacterium atrinae]|uniref:HAD-IA family hydrolase n=1 Tax=Corynebacterium atrinae TaxID=1336740 RepID=UPI0025B49403|nr:HAD-IA family hydrolase [Corynebacterium atrinae]WJY62236.1 Alpha-D-glucose-1-phosphate phosphatase YihX [Corynebacterium atrinae]